MTARRYRNGRDSLAVGVASVGGAVVCIGVPFAAHSVAPNSIDLVRLAALQAVVSWRAKGRRGRGRLEDLGVK